MKLELCKFGKVLDSRPAGREALLAIQPQLRRELGPDAALTLDFQDVDVLTPSFADEFVTPLVETYGPLVSFRNTENVTVRKTLAFLAKEWPEGVYQSEEEGRETSGVAPGS